MRILVIEDNLALSNLLASKLRKNYIVDQAFGLAKAYYFLDTRDYDALILDLVLPDGHGLEVCQYLKQNSISLPILFLSAEADMEQKIACLEIGSTDYVLKPFNFDELLSRLSLLLQKTSPSKEHSLQLGSLRLDSQKHRVFLSD